MSALTPRKTKTSNTATSTTNKLFVVTIDQLPYCLFHLISEYLSPTEYRNFMNTSLDLFEDIKRETVYYDLNTDSSLKFASNATFRNSILKKVSRKSKQVSLDFGRVSEFSQRVQIAGVHRCRIQYYPIRRNHRALNVSIFSGIEELCLFRFDRIVSFEGMEAVRKLHIEKLENLIDLSALSYLHSISMTDCPKVTNLNGLGRVYMVKIEKAPLLSDISALSGFNHSVSLVDCPLVTDVSNLGNVHSLTLVRCPLVNDVSKLHHVVNLNITDCPEIRDLRGLGRQTTVILGPCHARDYSMLKDVKNVVLISCDIDDLSFLDQHPSTSSSSSSLWPTTSPSSSSSSSSSSPSAFYSSNVLFNASESTVSVSIETDDSSRNGFMLLYCDSVSNVTYLQHMSYVTIGGNNLIEDISMLGNVGHLCFFGCPKIKSLQGLGKKNRYVEITDCEGVNDFTPLQNVYLVEISSCVGFTRSSDLKGVKHVTIDGCSELREVSGFDEANHVRLIKCDGITKLDNLHKVQMVEIKQCPCLTDISGLGGEDQEVSLEGCNRVSNIAPLKQVKKVKIRRCLNIDEDDIAMLKQTVKSVEFEPAMNFFSLGFLNIFFM